MMDCYGAVTGGSWPAIGYGLLGAIIGGPLPSSST